MLPIKVGSVTQQVLFSIIKDLGPYNAIMGQALLNSMKSIPSTNHQMVSYLTDVGQFDLLSSQLATRQCYQLFVREHRGRGSSKGLPLKDQTPV